MINNGKPGFATLQVHAGQTPDPATGSRACQYIRPRLMSLKIPNMPRDYSH